MNIQINTANDFHGSEESNAEIKKNMVDDFDRFKERITRLEVHLHDENAAKGGTSDKSCMIEARLAGRRPIAVDDNAATFAAAIHGATHKMLHRIESILGRESHHSKSQGIQENSSPDA